MKAFGEPKSLTVRLSPELHDAAARLARQRSMSLNALMQESLAALVVLWLVLSSEWLADALRAAAFAVPALVVGGWAFTRPALVDDGALRADRVSDGRLFAGLTLLAALAVALAAWRLPVARLAAVRSHPTVRRGDRVRRRARA